VESLARCCGVVVLLGALLGGGAVHVQAAGVESQLPRGYVDRLADLINDYRQANGLAPLALAEGLALLAGEHSEGMAGQRQLSHDGFRARFQRAASKICVENVGWNYATPEGLLEGWRLSPSHHRNLLEPKVGRMGIAVESRYVTFFACR
jgi:uncharacterized protein YkwD